MKVKKLICIILTVCIFVSVLPLASAASREDAYNTNLNDAYFRLSSLKIIPDDVIAGNRDGYVKRKEFAKYFTALISYDGITADGNIAFEDVADSEYSDSINTVAKLGYMTGNGTGRFYPDNFIKFEEAAKVLVEALGYFPAAKEKGGYPGGYLTVASDLGITKNVMCSPGKELSFENMALMFDAALESDMLVGNYDTENPLYKVESGVRLWEIRLKVLNLVYGSGTLDANEYTYIYGNESAPQGCVLIDGKVFKTGSTDAADMIGCKVEFYAENEKNGKISSIRRNTETRILKKNVRDISYVGNYLIGYCEEDGEETEIKLSQNYKLIYNGKNSDTTVSKLHIPEFGNITFTDSDSDKQYDIIFVDEAIYAEVEKVDADYGRIYLKNASLNGKAYVDFDAKAPDSYHTLTTVSGNNAQIDSLKSGDVLMIYASRDGNIMRIYISDEYISGKVTEITDNGYVVNGVSYPVLQTKELLKEVKLGAEGFFYIADGVIVNYRESENTPESKQYALVHAISKSGTLEKEICLRMISGCNFKIVEEDTNNDNMTDTRFLKLANTNVQTVVLDDYVKINGEKVAKEDVCNFLNPPYTIVKYGINSKEKVNEIEILQKHRDVDARMLNTSANLFGATVGGTFAYDAATEFFVLPHGNAYNFDDTQYFLTYKLKNKKSYNVVGFDVDADTKLAKAALVIPTSDCIDGAINSSTKISVVLKISEVFDTDGNPTRKISGYTGNERFEKLVCDSIADTAGNLAPGDLIYYSTDHKGRINRINIFKKLNTLLDFYSKKGTEEEYYGIAENVVCRDVSEYALDLVDTLTLDVSSDNSYKILETVPVSCTVAPPVYLYDKKHNVLGFSSTGDILSVSDCGYESASKVYVYKSESAVRVVLIINE